MAPITQFTQNQHMNEDTSKQLFDLAVDLAYQAFEEPSDDHIKGVYLRLVINHQWGLGDSGAVTVH
tara:strand:+ start:668 stop:865 length:198 start_codon:yes stop_codon:yes gene_type:complete